MSYVSKDNPDNDVLMPERRDDPLLILSRCQVGAVPLPERMRAHVDLLVSLVRMTDSRIRVQIIGGVLLPICVCQMLMGMWYRDIVFGQCYTEVRVDIFSQELRAISRIYHVVIILKILESF